MISRMKTVTTVFKEMKLRFVAVSATIPNTQDIAEWLGSIKNPAVKFKYKLVLFDIIITNNILHIRQTTALKTSNDRFRRCLVFYSKNTNKKLYAMSNFAVRFEI